MSTKIYVTRPAAWRGIHRRRTRVTPRAALAALAAIWIVGSVAGSLATAGVVR